MEVTLTQNYNSISELFDLAPKDWDDKVMDAMIEHLRKYRVELDKAPEKKAKAPKAPKEDLTGKSIEDLAAILDLEI